MLLESAAILIGYLLGSIPMAYIVARIRKGVDIREIGIGNMGSGNVMREVGMWEGLVVLAVDIGKGAAAIFIAQALGVSYPWLLAAGFAAVLGHCFPVYISFRGGQGVATIIGIGLALSPPVMGITCGIIGIALLLTRHLFSSIAITAPFFPLTVWLVEGSLMFICYAVALVLFVGFRSRHRLEEVRVITGKKKE